MSECVHEREKERERKREREGGGREGGREIEYLPLSKMSLHVFVVFFKNLHYYTHNWRDILYRLLHTLSHSLMASGPSSAFKKQAAKFK